MITKVKFTLCDIMNVHTVSKCTSSDIYRVLKKHLRNFKWMWYIILGPTFIKF